MSVRHDRAPDGYTYVCMACGKTSKNLYGGDGSGWDESCFLNSQIVEEKRLVKNENGLVTAIAP